MNGQHRKDIKPGLRVSMTQKHDQRTGKLTSGVVKDILTTSAFHSRGIKVRFVTGEWSGGVRCSGGFSLQRRPGTPLVPSISTSS